MEDLGDSGFDSPAALESCGVAAECIPAAASGVPPETSAVPAASVSPTSHDSQTPRNQQTNVISKEHISKNKQM
jgi:hypothetical protein